MRKLLSLVLAFAMILGLFAFPVSADATTYQQVGQELQALKVLKGVNAAGDLAELEKLTREQALVVLSRLVGQEEAALATDAQPGFADVPAAHWYSPYVAYAKAQGWTTGVSETEFGLGQSVTTKQALTFMMRALGYTADWSKEDIMKKAQELGLMEGVSAVADDAIIRGELFIIMKNTLYTKPMGEKIELIYKLGLAENPVPATLEVVDVKADNLKEVVVEFNQEVDKDTLKDAFKFVGSSHGTLTAKLQEDGKTVVISVEAGKELKNKKTYKLQVSNVKTLSGLMVEKVIKEFKADDNTVPTVESVVVTGPKNIQITFSEPVKIVTGSEGSKVKVSLATSNSGSNGSLKPVDGDERKVDVTTFALKDGSTYKALVSGFVDHAKYKNIDAEIEFEYAKVSDAPTVEVLSATQEYVEFKFNRPVKNVDLGNFYHTYSSWKPVALYASVEKMDEDVAKTTPSYGNKLPAGPVDKVVARFVKNVEKLKDTDRPLQVGDVEVNVLGKANSKKLVDNWGNQLQDATLKVSVTADKSAPVVENVEITEENEITVTFSKKVKPDKDNYELLKEDGGKLTETSIKDVKLDGNTKIKLILNNKKQVGKTVILNIKNVKDTTINQNKLVGTESFNLTFGDKTFEGMEEVSFHSHDGEVAKIRIQFKEAVDSETATNTKNYKIRKKGLTENISVNFELAMVTDKIVEMSFSKDDWKDGDKLDQDALAPFYNHAAKPLEVVMSNDVTDATGNKISGFQQFKEVLASAAAPKVKSVIAKSTSEIIVTFASEVEIEDLKAADFTVTGLANTPDVNDATLDGKKVTVTLDTAEGKHLLPFNAGGKLKFAGKPITTLAGGTLANFEIAIADEIKPEVAKLPKAVDVANIKNDPIYGHAGKLPLLNNSALEESEFKKAYEKLNLDDKPAAGLIWNGTNFVVRIEYTEAIKPVSLSEGTYKLTSDGGNYVWEFDGVPTEIAGSKFVEAKLVTPKADKVNEDLFRDVVLTQVNTIKDMSDNEFKYEDAITLQIVNQVKKADVVAIEVQAAKNALKAKVEELNVLLPNGDRVAAVHVPGGSADDYAKVETVNLNKPFVWSKANMMPEAAVTTFKAAVEAAWNAHEDATPANQTVEKYNQAKQTLEAAKAPYEAAKLVKVDSEEVTITVTAGAAADQTTITGHEATHKYYVLKLTATGERFSTTATPDTAGSYEVTADVTDQDVLKTTLSLSNGDKVLVIKVKDNKVVAQKELEATAVVNGL